MENAFFARCSPWRPTVCWPRGNRAALVHAEEEGQALVEEGLGAGGQRPPDSLFFFFRDVRRLALGCVDANFIE